MIREVSLDPEHIAYEQARQAVLDAANQADRDAAHEALRLAEAPVAAELEVAWRANIDAIQAAKAALETAVLEQAQVEVEVGNAARARDPIRPVLNAEEIARVTAAQAAAEEARQAILVAEQAFKVGVTVEQLVAVP